MEVVSRGERRGKILIPSRQKEGGEAFVIYFMLASMCWVGLFSSSNKGRRRRLVIIGQG